MKNHLAIIPARSGSKEIPHKNITLLLEKPLIAYTIEAALQSKVFDDVIISTDSKEYAKIACAHGAWVPFLRPESLSHDSVLLRDVSIHTIQTLEKMKYTYKHFTVLQATCPLRDYKDIQNAYDYFMKKNAEVVISIFKTKNPYYYSGILPESASLQDFIKPQYRNIQRQIMQKFYSISGALFMTKTHSYIHNSDPFTLDSFGFPISSSHALDIDSKEDLIYAQMLLERKMP